MASNRQGFWRPEFWTAAWYQGRWWLIFFLPLSWLFRRLASSRRKRQQAELRMEEGERRLSAPVIVVGNITLGGTGKTPLLIALTKYLQQQGYSPGIISRGYGGNAPSYPYRLTRDSRAEEVGDEPLLIQLETGCPIVVGPNRTQDAEKLLAETDCNIILSDDGLQHYQLPRDIEIAVIDGERGLGNGQCLPAGPLREPPERLQEVDLVVVNGDVRVQDPAINRVQTHSMSLVPSYWQSLMESKQLPITQLPCDNSADAIAGIGNPQRFFNTLKQLGLTPKGRAFADHYRYQPHDFSFVEDRPLLMTAKDAVKCRDFAKPDWWFLAVEAQLDEQFWSQLNTKLVGLKR